MTLSKSQSQTLPITLICSMTNKSDIGTQAVKLSPLAAGARFPEKERTKTMMKSSIYKALERMNELQKHAEKMRDKAWDKYQEGNIQASDRYDQKADTTIAVITGMKETFTILGLSVWQDKDGSWNIPLDDIEKVC